jgi:hypothetical protein
MFTLTKPLSHVYVLSDAKRITKDTKYYQVDFRMVHLKNDYVVTSDHPILLTAVSPSNEKYNVTKVSTQFLQTYCKHLNVGRIVLKETYCDVNTRKPIIKYELLEPKQNMYSKQDATTPEDIMASPESYMG